MLRPLSSSRDPSASWHGGRAGRWLISRTVSRAIHRAAAVGFVACSKPMDVQQQQKSTISHLYVYCACSRNIVAFISCARGRCVAGEIAEKLSTSCQALALRWKLAEFMLAVARSIPLAGATFFPRRWLILGTGSFSPSLEAGFVQRVHFLQLVSIFLPPSLPVTRVHDAMRDRTK